MGFGGAYLGRHECVSRWQRELLNPHQHVTNLALDFRGT
jgi:hypothetical protein